MKQHWILGGVLGAYALVVATLCFAPESAAAQWLSTRFGLAQLLAFPLLVGAALALVALILLTVFWRERALRWLCGGFLVVSLGLALFSADRRTVATDASADAAVRVVVWNTENQLDAESVRHIFRDFDADVAILPEWGDDERLVSLLEEVEIDPAAYDRFSSPLPYGDIAPVTIVIKHTFGHYRALAVPDMTTFGTLYLTADEAQRPDIIGLHTAPPLPGLLWPQWQRDVDFVADLTRRNPEAVIAGDFNATLSHGALASIQTHRDAVTATPPTQRGTWPAAFPAVWRASIDHLLLPNGRFRVTQADIVTLSTSDHAALFVELAEQSD